MLTSALVDEEKIATMQDENDRLLGKYGDQYAKLHPCVEFIHLLLEQSAHRVSDS